MDHPVYKLDNMISNKQKETNIVKEQSINEQVLVVIQVV